MAKSQYQTAPVPSENMPGGIPFIIGNEVAERFSFYGMKAILFVFMTEYLRNHAGQLDAMSPENATGYVHLFVAAAYFFPIIGAPIADAFWGKYGTILSLSIVYCLGHLVLAMDDTRLGLMVGLALIAVGSGGIKPCVSAHVGDQFGTKNQHLLTRVFSWFYFSINLGAFASTILTPVLLEKFGPHVAFGVPGALMLLATWVFWLGRGRFVHVPARGVGFIKEAFRGETRRSIARLCVIYLFIAMFWSLFDQTASKWVEQASHMDRTIDLSWIAWIDTGSIPQQIELLPSQIQAANPALILILIPIFSHIIYPALSSVFLLTPLRKISIGFFITAIAFSISAWIQMQIDAGQTPHIIWQILAYIVLTAAEVMVSITGLEFSYTQAPNQVKSIIMSLFLLSVSVGNAFTAGVNFFILNEDKSSKLEGADYYWFFTAAMLVTSVVFIFVSQRYRGRTYVQDQQPVDLTEAEN